MKDGFHGKILEVWEKIEIGSIVSDMNLQIESQYAFLEFASPGNLYYYIFDVKKGEFVYLSPKIKNVLGYDATTINFHKYLNLIHPDDQAILVKFESRIVDFYHNLPAEKIAKYKFSYDLRLKAKSGKYLRILQQTIPINHIAEEDTLLTLGIHSDISHLKKNSTPTLSFVGLGGEPSFYDVFTTEKNKSLPEFSKRELEIIRLLALGFNSPAIAEKLHISTHTVNSHRKNMHLKSNSKTTAELVILAMTAGIL